MSDDSFIDLELHDTAEGVLKDLLGGDYASGWRTMGGGADDGGDYMEIRLDETALRRLCSPLVLLAREGEAVEKTAEQVANEMWDHLGSIDWRYVGPAGLLQATVHADTVKRWCEAMGWEWPEGMARAIEADRRDKIIERHRVQRLPSGRFAVYDGDEPLRDAGGRTRTWATEESAEDTIYKVALAKEAL